MSGDRIYLENTRDYVLRHGETVGFWGTPIQQHVIATNPYDTDVSTVDTIHQMIALARESASSPIINNVVNSLLKTLPVNPSKRELVRATFWWIKNHVRFLEDEAILAQQLGWQDVNQELLIPPAVLLEMPTPSGDCDDFSMLFASLMVAAKIPVWFVTVACDVQQPFRFSHVYTKVWLSDEPSFVPVDCSHGKFIGWETTDDIFRREEWLVN